MAEFPCFNYVNIMHLYDEGHSLRLRLVQLIHLLRKLAHRISLFLLQGRYSLFRMNLGLLHISTHFLEFCFSFLVQLHL